MESRDLAVKSVGGFRWFLSFSSLLWGNGSVNWCRVREGAEDGSLGCYCGSWDGHADHARQRSVRACSGHRVGQLWGCEADEGPEDLGARRGQVHREG